MARKLYYKVIDDGKNKITDMQWDSILRLQHWYNSEFIWTAGKLGFRMFAVFPNQDLDDKNVEYIGLKIQKRRKDLQKKGLTENETLQKLESEGLIVVQKGGYFDNCIASGFTRVAANEFNAYLVCEFLLKASILAPEVKISVYDEGEFIKPKRIKLYKGDVIICTNSDSNLLTVQEMINNRHVFAIVDPAKYDRFPKFTNIIKDFIDLKLDERLSILKDWNWLGFEDNFDLHGDDVQGFDLNKKVAYFSSEPQK